MEKRFQHSAGAYGISGKFLWPISEAIKVRPSVDLPPIGGFGQDIEKNYNFHELVSFSRAYTEVSGSPNVETVDGKSIPAENNLSLAVIEDFNLLQVVEVRKLVSRITTRYFHGAEDIEVVLSGTRYEGFRIFGQEIIIKLATDLILGNPTLPKLRDSYKSDEAFRERYHKLSGGKEVPEDDSTLELTIVEDIFAASRPTEFRVDRNVIEIPHVGRLFLGELTVTPTSKSLNLIRWELGCPSGGNGTIGGGQGGGSPPSS
jgi:hypothetical protein